MINLEYRHLSSTHGPSLFIGFYTADHSKESEKLHPIIPDDADKFIVQRLELKDMGIERCDKR